MKYRAAALLAAALLLAGCAPHTVTPAEETAAGGFVEQSFSIPENFYCETLVTNPDNTLTLYGGEDGIAWRDPSGIRGGVLACTVQPDGKMELYTPAWNEQLLQLCADTPGVQISLAADEEGAVYILADQPGAETPFRLWRAEGENLAEIPVDFSGCTLTEDPLPEEVVCSLSGVSGEYMFVETNANTWAVFGTDGKRYTQGAEDTSFQAGAVRSGYVWVGFNGFAPAYTLPEFEPASRLSLPDGSIFPDWEGRGFYHISMGWEQEAVVSHYNLDGSTREILMRGSDYSWGAPTASVFHAGQTPDGALWLIVSEAKKQTLCRYVYDPNLTVENTLTVYSLHNSDAVRQAIALWNTQHPTVRVEYTVGMEDGETGLTEEDVIRRLNTELLSGDGPDLLFLDGLPVQSMIREGILANLAPLADWSDVRENILSACEEDGAVYGVPTGFSTWIAGGRPEDVDSRLETLEGLAEAVTSQSKDDPYLYLQNFLYEQLFDLFYPASAPAIWQDGTFRPDACRAFLSELDAMAASAGLQTIDTFDSQNEGGTSAQELYDTFPISGTLSEFYNRPYGTGGRWFVEEWQDAVQAAEFSVLVRDDDGRLAPNQYGEVSLYPIPGVGGGSWFEAKGVAAIPKTSEENRDLAIEFIRLMLSDEMQQKSLEGLPVTRSGWTAALDKVREHSPFGTTNDLDAFVDSMQPVWIDKNLQKTVRTWAAAEYSGELSMEDALRKIEQEASLSLAERD